MPFKSEQQRKFMWSQHPDIAQRWANEYPNSAVERKIKRKKKRASKVK